MRLLHGSLVVGAKVEINVEVEMLCDWPSNTKYHTNTYLNVLKGELSIMKAALVCFKLH